MVEQILQLLPEPCEYKIRGCSSLAPPNHLQYCEYRPIKCVLGADYICKWTGNVKDWFVHAKNNHIVVEYPNEPSPSRLTYQNFCTWTAYGSFHYYDDNSFLVFAIKKNGMLCQTVKHISVRKSNEQYFLDTTITDNDDNFVLYRAIVSPRLLLPNDSFETDSISFKIVDLNDATDAHGNLSMYRTFSKYSQS